MANEYDIVDVLAGEISPGVEGWGVVISRSDASRYQHVFPKAAFEWRAAEYGLTDPDEILDVILHEPYLDAVETPPLRSVTAPPAPPAGEAPPRTPSPSLFEAESTSEARAAHRARIAEVKARKVQITDPGAMRRHILDHHGMDPDRVRAKQEAVDIRRWAHQYGSLPAPPHPSPIPLDETAQLRARQMEADSA